MSSERRTRGLGPAVALITVALLLPSLADAARQGPLFYPDDPLRVDRDDRPVPAPAYHDVSLQLDVLRKIVDPPADGEAPRAMNVNTLGQVPDSSWFSRRHGRERLTPDELRRGPNRTGPPAEGTWRVVGHPGEGFTPKLIIEDAEGRKYLLKFDNAENPGMRSGTEAICTRFFWALGYNTPENYVVSFHPDRLVVDVREVEDVDPADVLSGVHRDAEGRVRALASLWLPGEALGPFRYEGTRQDDPNDIFPHQHRRELRGLRVFAAWLNHTDIKPGNSFDSFITDENDLGHVRHYLMDFGSCMGSGAEDPKDHLVGYEEYFELDEALKSIFSLGLYVRPAVEVDYPDRPAVGNFEAEYFEPWRWKPPIPNPALALMDAADAFWAARIASRFTDDDVRLLVETGKILRSSDRNYLAEILIARRDKAVEYWLTRTNPLEDFRVAAGPVLEFDNAAEEAGIVPEDRSLYEVRWHRLDNDNANFTPLGDPVDLGPERRVRLRDDAWGPEDEFGLRYSAVDVSTGHPDYPHWSRRVRVVLRNGPDRVEVVGVRRPTQMPPAPEDEEEAVVAEEQE